MPATLGSKRLNFELAARGIEFRKEEVALADEHSPLGSYIGPYSYEITSIEVAGNLQGPAQHRSQIDGALDLGTPRPRRHSAPAGPAPG